MSECLNCGKLTANQKYCSKSCYNKFTKTGIRRNITWGKNISKALKGRKITWKAKIGRKGRKLTEEQKIQFRKLLEKRKIKRGKDSPLWKGGITPIWFAIRTCREYNQWRVNIFQRDNFTCQECFEKKHNLNAHHKNKTFSRLLQEFLQQYSQFSPLEDKETLVRLAITYEPFWDIDNGQTLCEECHNLTKRKKCKTNTQSSILLLAV